MKLIARYILVLVLLSLCALSFAQARRTITGRVVGVTDGDTITVLDSNRQQHKIRLNGIDAPESGQDFGQPSKRNLSDLVFGKDVVVIWRKRDRYDRILSKVMVGSTDVNLQQIRDGFAWYFKRYEADVPLEDRPVYDRAEQEARQARRGLWQRPNPQPPWEYRAGKRGSPPSTPPATTPRQTSGRIIGNRNSMIYHRPDCPDYGKVSERNRVYFGSEAEAAAAGFRRARNCR